MSDLAWIRERVDGLLDKMSVEEKAGQLTQYFYFGFLRDAPPGDADGMRGPNQPARVEAAWRVARRDRCSS